MKYFLVGVLFWSIIALAIYSVRPNAFLSKETVEKISIKGRIITILILTAIILLCILPMSLSPLWNGEIPSHYNEYEVFTESLLDGRIDLDYGDMDPRLLEMQNPYDTDLRKELEIFYHWDHAFYNGKYYMYFGIVPVFLTFLPFRIITGSSLTTYHATQIFTAFIIIGIFCLFHLISKKYFKKMVMSVYLSLSAAMSIMSVWYFSEAPALYCTAISAGVCMEIWSIIFLFKAVYIDPYKEKYKTIWFVLGGSFGALAFGCRPTVAIANLLLIPIIYRYIKERRFGLKVLKQLIILLIPYIVIGTLLMLYNYIRFDNPFEFGQSYQLTVADQSKYGNFFANFDIVNLINGIIENFFEYKPISTSFPYISYQSVFFNFPICMIAAFCLFQKDTLIALKKERLIGLVCGLILCTIFITSIQILQSPFLIERYRSDIYWIIGIILFITFGIFIKTLQEKSRKLWNFIIPLLSVATVFGAFLLWLVPNDGNFTLMFPEYLTKIENMLQLGF